MIMKKTFKHQAIIVMVLCAVFLFVKYIAQLFPSLIGQTLMQKYSIDGLQLGILASSYYYSYSIMQVFSGVILDKFSIRLAAFSAVFLMAIGLYVFSEFHSFEVMCLSRVLMGVGASFATVLYMKCAAIWTSRKSFAMISSLLATATMLGAAAGGAPLSYLFHFNGWRYGIVVISIVSAVLAVLCLFFISGKGDHKETLSTEKTKLSTVLFNKQNWMLMAYSGFVFSPVVILGGLWGMPFLKLKYGITTQTGSYLLSIMFIGLAVGAPIWSYFSVKFDARKSIMQLANFLSLVCVLLILYAPVSYDFAVFLFFALGFCVGCFMISFSICKEINPFMLLGLAFAFMNMGEGIVGSVVEPAIGWLLDILTPAHSSFTITAFHEAMSLLPACFICASFLLQRITTRIQINEVNAHV